MWDSLDDLSSQVWPEYNTRGDVLNPYWNRLYDERPERQFVLYDEDERVPLAEGHTIPVSWGRHRRRTRPGHRRGDRGRVRAARR